jgi:hypothetical protein
LLLVLNEEEGGHGADVIFNSNFLALIDINLEKRAVELAG